MGFDTTPVRPLGKIWTLGQVGKTLEQWLQKETQKELNPEFVKTLINVAVGDVAEFLSGAGIGDYIKIYTINDQASSIANPVAGATYTNSTKTITKTAHGLTTADIGRRIVYIDGSSLGAIPAVVIAEIEDITDEDNFVVSIARGSDMSTVEYAVFSAHSTTNIDLAAYRVAEVVKLTDSITKQIRKIGSEAFENHARYPERQKEIVWYTAGDYLFIRKGDDITMFGTLQMHIASYPQLFTDEDSKLDIRDMYVPSLVIPQAKLNCIEHLQMTAKISSQELDSKKRELRDNILKEKQAIQERNKTNQVSN